MIYVVLNWWYGDPVFGHLAIDEEGTVLIWDNRTEADEWARENLTGNYQVILLEESK